MNHIKLHAMQAIWTLWLNETMYQTVQLNHANNTVNLAKVMKSWVLILELCIGGKINAYTHYVTNNILRI